MIAAAFYFCMGLGASDIPDTLPGPTCVVAMDTLHDCQTYAMASLDTLMIEDADWRGTCQQKTPQGWHVVWRLSRDAVLAHKGLKTIK